MGKLYNFWKVPNVQYNYIKANITVLFLPGCLASLGFIQRTYDGSLDIRISISLAKLSLNCVAAWAKDNQT